MKNHLEPLNFDLLKIFATVADLSSFSAAATKLGLEKSKVSRSIQALELQWGEQLFYRTTRDIRLTDLGLKLHKNIAPGLQSLKEGLKSLESSSTELSGTIRLTSVEDIGAKILAPILSKFAEIHPQVQFDLFCTLESLDLIKEGIDVAIRVGPTQQSSYNTRGAGHIDFILVAHADYLRRHKNISAPKDLLSHKILSFRRGDVKSQTITLSKGSTKELVQWNTHMTSTSSEVLLQWAKDGRGIAYVPRFICEDVLKTGALNQVLPDWQLPIRKLNVVTPGKPKKSSLVDQFIKFLMAQLENAVH